MADGLKIGIVAGERSGERLAVDLVTSLRKTDRNVEIFGVGGADLQALGMETLFDPEDIALMGVSAVVKSLPKLIGRIKQTADYFAAEKPDIVVFVDSPDFCHRVAKRLRKSAPHVKTMKYVAPTVWAWRPGRAAAMKAYIDHVLALFPFEPQVMHDLGGPTTSYVGHPLASDEMLKQAWNKRMSGAHADGASKAMTLVVLPGSRSIEIKALLGDMAETVKLLAERGNKLKIFIPTLPRHADFLRLKTADWPVTPVITTSREDQIRAYEQAEVALCASGTVTLELALAGVPAVSVYRTDALIKPFRHLITSWSAALPNIIADRPIIAEFYDVMVRPAMLARHLEDLAEPTSVRRKMTLMGYGDVRDAMSIEGDPATNAAKVVLKELT